MLLVDLFLTLFIVCFCLGFFGKCMKIRVSGGEERVCNHTGTKAYKNT